MKRIIYLDKFRKEAIGLFELTSSKGQDYATEEDAFRNYRVGEDIGVPVKKMILLRLLEKVERVKNLEGREANHESLADSWKDIAILSIQLKILYEEEALKTKSSKKAR